MAILGRRRKPTESASGVQADDERAEDSASAADASDALALAAERAGEIVIAARDILNALEVARGSGSGGERFKAGLLENLADSTRQLHSEAQELGRRLGATRREIGDSRSVSAPARSEPRVSEKPEPPAPAKTEPQAPTPFEPPSPGVKALVTQMAAFGSSRLEIEERLRDDFGLANAAALVAHVLDDASDEAREAS